MGKYDSSFGKQELTALDSRLNYALKVCKTFSPSFVDVIFNSGDNFAKTKSGLVLGNFEISLDYIIRPTDLEAEYKTGFYNGVTVNEVIANFGYDPKIDFTGEKKLRNNNSDCISEAMGQIGQRLELLLENENVSELKYAKKNEELVIVDLDYLRENFKEISPISYILKDKLYF